MNLIKKIKSLSSMEVKKRNGVFYTATSDPSLVKYKTVKRHYALHDNYTASPTCQQDMQFQLALGSEYVDAFHSYLRFTLRYNSVSDTEPLITHPASLSSGFTDLFRHILIVDRNGVTLERIENVYQIASILATSMYTTDKLYHTTNVFPEDKDLERDTDIEVIVPLHFLCGLFRTDTLLPPHILDGATIRICLRNANMVFQPTAVNVPNYATQEQWTYTIKNPMIVAESYVFDKRLHDLVTQEYSAGGLHFPFVSHTSLSRPVPSTKFTEALQIRQPFTRALKVFLSTEVFFSDDFKNAYVDNFSATRVTGPWVYESLQAKVGDNTFPNTTLESRVEGWQLWVSAFKKHRGSCGIAAEAKSDFDSAQRVLIDCNRGVIDGVSGVTVNAKFPCVLALTMRADRDVTSINPGLAAQVVPRVLHVFVEHQRIIIASKDSTKVAV